MSQKQRQPKRGIILLVVLGMLSLFSVLVVSYVVFSSQMSDRSFASNEKQLSEIPAEPILDNAILSLIVGTNDPQSATFGHSIMEDLYGTDGLLMRVGHRRGGATNTNPVPAPALSQGLLRGGLLRPLDATKKPLCTLFKLPTNAALWYDNGSGLVPGNIPRFVDPSDTAYAAAAALPGYSYPDVQVFLDDVFAGRSLTFTEGPLYGVTFRVIRSFGADNVGSDFELGLAGSVVIDLSELPSEELSIDGSDEPLYLTAAISPNRLLYDAGNDELPGRGGVDDDGANGVDDFGEMGFPNSDDIGYRFIVNGRPFNGRGQNPSGQTGLKRMPPNPADPFDPFDQLAHIELQPNARLMGTQVASGTNATFEYPEPDEQWDAADFENWFLAWQPSDHRRSIAALDPNQHAVHSDPELNRQLGQHIIPSFHRPAVINYLMNAPIRLSGDPPGFDRTFADVASGFDTNSPNRDNFRLSALILRLRRATMRPLNFEHMFFAASSSDLNNDQNPFDGAPGFSGSNPTPILSETIQTDVAVPPIQEIRQLASWLINGPWDVDNDNDGIPDSVWVDFNLPPVQAPDGRWIKPMFAPLIEDLDGKINLNTAGSYHQLLTQRFRSQNLTSYTAPGTGQETQYFSVLSSLGVFGRGGGVGPAEIDFSHLFDEANGPESNPSSTVPYFQTQTLPPPSAVLNTRYGNLLNTRYGGQVFNYIAPYPTGSFTKFPAANLIPPPPGSPPPLPEPNPQPYTDLLSRVPFPARLNWHAAFAPMGQPIDITGRSQIRKDRYGNQRFTNMSRPTQFLWGNELVNTPYESGIDGSRGDDKPFTADEYHDFINGGELAGRLTQLLGDAADKNAALRRLLTTESRSLDVPELVGEHDIIHLIASKVAATNPQVHLDRMLAVELRKGSKLNLNRPLGNGINDNGPDFNTDESFETETRLNAPVNLNYANNRRSRENAFPKIAPTHANQASAPARYTVNEYDLKAPVTQQDEFNGIDVNGNGVLDANEGRDFDGDGIPERIASGNELLARHLYCLMLSLIADPSSTLLVKDFPYPNNFVADDATRNRYAARRIAQWAANAVDYRDIDVRCTRLRYDPNPFDANGFDLATAQRTVVWGMESPELEITETVAFHDKRLKRNLAKEEDPMDPLKSLDGELQADEDPDDTDGDAPDSDMDQFRVPEPSAYVEIHSLRSPIANTGTGQLSYPPELYVNAGTATNPLPRLDLGRIVGSGNLRSPVYRLAVGQATAGQRGRSTRWNFDAERVGRQLVAGDGRAEELDYLTTPAIDYNNGGDVNTEVDTWNQATRHAAEVRHSLSTNNEFVTIADDDFDPTNDSGSDHRIRLERFVWFTKESILKPDATLNVIANNASGMRLGNVFYNKNDLDDPADATDPDNVTPTLGPGQYAIIGPREETRFGQTTGSSAPTYPYSPVDHRLVFEDQTAGAAPPFRFNMFDFAGIRLTPRYAEDGAGYDVDSVVPILCQSLYPHEVDPGRSDWNSYRTNNPADEVVDMGFNISAPESGASYYLAPTHRIANMGGKYPLLDGYRDYDNDVGFHPDTPLDHQAGTPLEDNGWNAVGTHQEARTVFLQRLADPTSPWHPIDNPYLTMDFMPVDLTTFNGEHDVRQEIDRDGDGNVTEMVDNRTNWDPMTGEFEPELKFDSRRKIPDVTRDRAITVLLSNQNPTVDPGQEIDNYDRVIMAKRSAMSASASVLRDTPEDEGANGYWKFSLGSHWNNGNEATTAVAPDTSYSVNPTLDDAATAFRQTLGFVNREYGKPVRSNSPHARSLGFGTPDEVFLSAVPWPNREFQSPLDLINVPAVSRTGILPTFSPGTELQDNAMREVPGFFAHLLGFNAAYANYRAADESALDDVGPHSSNVEDMTGDRAGFESIFDHVDTGPVWFDSQRWFEPNQVSFLQGDPNDSAVLTARDNMFNRVVATLQPPFNFIGKHRTPGRVNLNTTPDYVRHGSSYSSTFPPPASPPPPTFRPLVDHPNRFLDAGEEPDSVATVGTGRVASDLNNSNVNGNGFSGQFRNNSILYGNGSVYRSLTWGISTAYELDNAYGSPSVMGEESGYATTVDTNFGLSFKAFIESRRGYSGTQASSLFGNPMLDWRYPTQFAGIFAPAQAAAVPSVQRFMRTESDKGVGVRRRTHDMSLLRPHPDFDVRTMTDTARNNVQMAGDTSYSLLVEEDPPKPGWMPTPLQLSAPPEVADLRMPLVNTGLFERPQAELHQNFRNLDRDAFFRHQNAARLANLTTHHSNVFLVRMTLGYFVVDPATGSVSSEYVTDTGGNLRSKASYIIDRSIPIGFLRGMDVNAMNTVIYSAIEE